MIRWVVYDFEDGTTKWVKNGYDEADLFLKIQEHGNVTCKLSYTF